MRLPIKTAAKIQAAVILDQTRAKFARHGDDRPC